MAWTAPKTWTGGERLYASDLNTYVSDNLADLDPRTVKTFADASARTSGIPSPTEGMLSYLADTDAVEVYDGSAWVSVAPTPAAPAILQVVSTTKTDTFSTASNSLTGVTGLSVSITPSSASSKVLVIARASVSGNPNNTKVATGLLRGATLLALGDASGSRKQSMDTVAVAFTQYADPSMLLHLDSPSTTSATTYQVAITNTEQNGQTVYVNRSDNDANSGTIFRTSSTITAMEVA